MFLPFTFLIDGGHNILAKDSKFFIGFRWLRKFFSPRDSNLFHNHRIAKSIYENVDQTGKWGTW